MEEVKHQDKNQDCGLRPAGSTSRILDTIKFVLRELGGVIPMVIQIVKLFKKK